MLAHFLFFCQATRSTHKQEEGEAPESEWVSVVGGGFTKEDDFCIDVRRLQQRTGCSDSTCEDIIKTFRRYLRIDAPQNFRQADGKMKSVAGTKCLRLNGCTGCHGHVYLPDDGAKCCPLCGHARYNAKGKPHEVSRALSIQYPYSYHCFLHLIHI